MAEIEARHQADKQKEEIEKLWQRQSLDALEIDRQRAVRTALTASLVLLALVIAVKTRAGRQIARRNEELREALGKLEESEGHYRQLEEERVRRRQQESRIVEIEAKNAALATNNAQLRRYVTEPLRFCLRWRHDGLRERCFLLSPGENVIGRARDSDVAVPMDGVSRRHARLILDSDRLALTDLGSTHGTWVNGQRVERADLNPGDSVRFASVELQLDQIEAQDAELGMELDDSLGPMHDEAPECDGDDLTSTSMARPVDCGSPDCGSPDCGSPDCGPDDLVFPEGYLPASSASMQETYQAMRSLLGSDLAVLIDGETGVGKEGIARILHMSSRRRDAAFVAVNCAAIPGELLEAEMFGIGHRVATGVSRRAGMFRNAEGGTLFLDEVGEMPLPLQAKLLRAVQEKKIQPVGGDELPVDVRVVAAANQDLLSLAEDGKFRSDLYYRLAGCVLRIPPLRERRDDVVPLLEHFLRKAASAEGKRIRGLTVKALAVLREYDWPGNVRELEHEVKRLACQAADAQMIDSAMLSERLLGHGRNGSPHPPPAGRPALEEPPAIMEETGSLRLKDHVHKAERHIILQALAKVGRSRRKAAALLGISRSTLTRKIADLGISV